MIKINFTEPTSSKWRTWRKRCEEKTRQLVECAERGEKPSKILNNLYKQKNIKDDYYITDKAPFYGKCAYCESKIIHDQYVDIEHFRPAKAVTDINDNLVMISTPRDAYPHPGYYWLAYDWKNLLPSCEKCNRPSTAGDKKIGKHNRFPVRDNKYAVSPGGEAEEHPLLINPLWEDPEKHLDIELKTGILGDLDLRGRLCIDIYGLNDRDGLRKERIKTYQWAKGLLARLMFCDEKSQDAEDCKNDLCKILIGDCAYSFVGRKTIYQKSPGLYEELKNICPKDTE